MCETYELNRIHTMRQQQEHHLKNTMFYNEKMDNEPEEGEIIDYYEIISSDEEFMVRQRIEELEAKNKEIEQIAVISNSYTNYSNIPYPYHNSWNKTYAQNNTHLKRGYKHSDELSISSNEQISSRKYKSRKGKDTKRRHNHRHFRNHSRENLCHRKRSSRHLSDGINRHKRYKDENYGNEIYLDSSSSSSVQCYSNDDDIRYLSDGNDEINRNNCIDRRILRFAVGRNRSHSNSFRNKASLKERLLNKEERKERRSGNGLMLMANHNDPQIQTIEDSSDSLEEQELRLIALKSAIHKKHIQRQKRDAETAYSPTDFDNLFDSNQDNKNDIEMDLDVDDDIQGIDITYSPIASPKLLLTPPHCIDETQCSQTSQNSMVNTKLVDMEIANSDSEIEPPKWPLNERLAGAEGDANDMDFKTAFKFIKTEHSIDLFVPEIKLEMTQPPPPPPSAAAAAAAATPANFLTNPKIPQHSPAQRREENLTAQEMDIDCNDITVDDGEQQKKISSEEDVAVEEVVVVDEEEEQEEDQDDQNEQDEEGEVEEEELEEEEEELALRALLLSQFQTGKSKRCRNTTNPTPESILKEAVRRFKLNTKENNTNNTIIKIKNEDKPFQINANSNLIKARNIGNIETNRNLERSKTHPLKEYIENREICNEPKEDGHELTSNTSQIQAANKTRTPPPVNNFNENDHQPNVILYNSKVKDGKRNTKLTIDKKNSIANRNLSTYSMLKTRKIIKPNKIINNIQIGKTQDKGGQHQKLDLANINNMMNDKNKQNEETRLITNMEQVKTICKVPNLIINLKDRSSSLSTCSSLSSTCSNGSPTEDSYNAALKLIHDYHDNDSPISLNLDNASSYSTCPTQGNLDDGKFEAKLNDFLKTIRSKVQQQNISQQTLDILSGTKKPKTTLANSQSKTNTTTPMAVRHLPQAAQAEYRRLVYRMKMLENRRNSLQNTRNPSNPMKHNQTIMETITESKTNLIENLKKKEESNPPENNSNDDNLENTNKRNKDQANSNTDNQQTVNLEEDKRQATSMDLYEKSYKKIGTGILNYLEHSLRLVEDAKLAKIHKLQLENRIIDLKKEIDLLQKQQHLEELKIIKIYPNISKTNTIITNLKSKRLQILKTLLKFDKKQFGSEYRIVKDDLKLEISEKSKQLLENIKLVNSLQNHNIHKYLQKEKDKDKGKEKEKEIYDNTKKKTNHKQVSSHPNTRKLSSSEKKPAALAADQTVKSTLPTTHTTVTTTTTSNADSNNVLKATASTTTITTITPSVTTSVTSCSTRNDNNVCSSSTASASAITMEIADGVKDADQLNQTNNNSLDELDDEGNDVREQQQQQKEGSLVYISPLDHIRNTQSDMDPQAILCPFELQGKCQDANCSYVHLNQEGKKKMVEVVEVVEEEDNKKSKDHISNPE